MSDQLEMHQQLKLREQIDKLQLGLPGGYLSPEDLLENFRTGGIDAQQLAQLMRVFDTGGTDEDTEEEEPDTSGASDHTCPCCDEQLALTEEVFLLEVVDSLQQHGKIITGPLVGADNDYQYPPLFLHLLCWEECLEIIKNEKEFQPAYASADGILFCSVCDSTIAALEPYVSTTFGELRYSRKSPDEEGTQRFERLQASKPVCLACLVYVIEDHLDELEDLLDNIQDEEDEDEEEVEE